MHRMAYRLLALGLAAFQAYASALPSDILRPRFAPDLRYVALGDSFSAGIGAGRFLKGSRDESRNNKCARMDGSYPAQVKQLVSGITPFDAVSCSGDKLDQIPGQVNLLGGDKYDVISLSISGNDFDFANVVLNCVYQQRNFFRGPAEVRKRCDQALNAATEKIDDETRWENYRQKLRLIHDQALAPNGHIYITGYAAFFSAEAARGDFCDEHCFFNVNAAMKAFLCAINIEYDIRLTMNDLVGKVNAKIESDVITPIENELPDLKTRVHYIDIDPSFNGHRFCERFNEGDAWGKTDDDVWFFEISSNVEETDIWEGPVDHSDFWFPNITDTDFANAGIAGDDLSPRGGRGLGDKFQQALVFHPKKPAHESTARIIANQIVTNQYPAEDFVRGGETFQMGFSPGGGPTMFRVPQGCVAIRPFDNTIPQPFCLDGRDVELETVAA